MRFGLNPGSRRRTRALFTFNSKALVSVVPRNCVPGVVPLLPSSFQEACAYARAGRQHRAVTHRQSSLLFITEFNLVDSVAAGCGSGLASAASAFSRAQRLYGGEVTRKFMARLVVSGSCLIGYPGAKGSLGRECLTFGAKAGIGYEILQSSQPRA